MNAVRINILGEENNHSSDISSFSPLTRLQVIPSPSPNTMAHDDDDHPFYHRGGHHTASSKVMLIAFFSLFFVVLLIILLILYAKCVLGRRARRRALVHYLNAPASAAQTHTHELPKTGLDPSVIATLPTFVYKKTGAPNDSGAECAVCLSALEAEEMARILPNCRHVFHAQCIDMWLNSHSTCPVCRTGAEPQEGQGSEPAVFAASAPPLDRSMSMGLEGTSDAVGQSSKEGGGSVSRLSSFRRILSRQRSDRRMQSGGEDLERQ